jgi:hypothetical protein
MYYYQFHSTIPAVISQAACVLCHGPLNYTGTADIIRLRSFLTKLLDVPCLRYSAPRFA